MRARIALLSLSGKRLSRMSVKTTRHTFAPLVVHLGKDEVEELPEGGVFWHAFVAVDEVVAAPERGTQHLRIGAARRASDTTQRVPSDSSASGQSHAARNQFETGFSLRRRSIRGRWSRGRTRRIGAATMNSFNSSRFFAACSWSRSLVTPFLPFLGSGRQTTTRRKFSSVCSFSIVKNRNLDLLAPRLSADLG